MREHRQPKRIGRFRIIETIGHGATATVYKAYDPKTDRCVAIKQILGQYRDHPGYLARFHCESRIAGRLSAHRKIATVFSTGAHRGLPFITMEYVGGENLQQKLASIGKFSIERTVQIGLQVVHALSYIHQLGFVHCDLKTANILLEEDSDEIRIIDFGVARSMPASTCLKPDAKEIAGSPLYMSPEQLAGRPVDERSDIFSLGVLLYELVSGRKPFESDSMEEISLVIRHYDPEPLYQFLEAIPPLLNHLIEKCLEKNPFSRYQSAGKCGVALQQIDQCINRSVSQCGNPHGHRNLNEE